MQPHREVLIIGAGPTGLATALFLTQKGYRPRIIDRNTSPSPYSKAFGVNARSLELLEATGVTARFLQHGRRMTNLNLHHHDRILAQLRLGEVQHRYPFMCVQSQEASERMLREALAERGIEVEWGSAVEHIHDGDGRPAVEVRTATGSSTMKPDIVLAADGASSSVRKALGISFEGVKYDEPWKLYDLELTGPLDADDGHIFLLDDGGMFVVRHESNVWRVLGNVPDMLKRLPASTQLGPVHWESQFAISNRVAGRFSKGAIYLAGDAAHIHAGIGARGMNLGIEDAFVFAELHHRGELDRYDALRRPVINKVVGQIQRAMAVPRATTLPGRLVRTFPRMIQFLVPLARSRVQPWILGLDHELGIIT